MKDLIKKLLVRVNEPMWQSAYIILIGLAISLVTFISIKTGVEIPASFYWTIVSAMCLMFALSSSLIGLGNVGGWDKYLLKSILFYFITFLVLGTIASFFSGVMWNELEKSYFVLFGSLTIGYIVFVTIAGFMKKVKALLDKEEAYHKEQSRKRKR